MIKDAIYIMLTALFVILCITLGYIYKVNSEWFNIWLIISYCIFLCFLEYRRDKERKHELKLWKEKIEMEKVAKSL